MLTVQPAHQENLVARVVPCVPRVEVRCGYCIRTKAFAAKNKFYDSGTVCMSYQ